MVVTGYKMTKKWVRNDQSRYEMTWVRNDWKPSRLGRCRTHGEQLITKAVKSCNSGAYPGFLDRGFKFAEGGSICAVCLIFPEIPHENEII